MKPIPHTARVLLLVLAGGAVVVVARDQWSAAVHAVAELPAVHRVEAHRDVILAAARESGVAPELLAGVMMAESSGRVDARSPKNALGLFQLMLPTAQERARVLGLPPPTEEDLLTDPLLNARLGADYLAWLLDHTGGDLVRALASYNAGPGAVARWSAEAGGFEAWRAEREASGTSEVLAYVAKVLRLRDRFTARGVFDEGAAEESP